MTAAKVRNIIMRDEGLQTNQTAVTGTFTSASNGQAGYQYFSLGDPANVQTNIPAIISNDDKKFTLRQMYMKLKLYNATNMPLSFLCYKCVARSNTGSTFFASLQKNFNFTGVPGIDSTQGHEFRRQFKIVKRKAFHMPAMGYKTLMLKYFYKGGKCITGEVEGNTLNYTFTPLGAVWFVNVTGAVCDDAAAGSILTTGLIKVNFIRNDFFSWYADTGANDPNNSASTVIVQGTSALNVMTDVYKVTEQNDT